MKILINHPNLKQDEKFDKNDLNFVQLLETDSELEDLVIKARIACNVPRDGFDLDKPVSEYNDDAINPFSKTNFNKITSEATFIKILYGLPNSWISTFISIILFNLATPPMKTIIKPIEIKSDKYEVTVVIREKTSLRKIKSYLRDNQKSLNEYLKTLPIGPMISVKDIGIKKRMLELKNNGLSPKDLAKKLDTEYGNDLPFTADYEIVSSEIGRFKNYLKKILSKDWRTAYAHLILDVIKHNKTK